MLTIFGALLAALAPFASADADWDARIVGATGTVSVLLASEGVSQPYPAQDGLPLSPGDSVTTGNDGRALLTLSGEHSITLLPDSSITIASVSKSQTLFDLARGRLLAFISPLSSDQKLSVETPQAVAAVRGTEFGVDAGASQASVGVFDEGHVEVFSPSGRVLIGPNQETSVAPGKTPLPPRALTRRFLRYRPFLKALRRQWRQVRRSWPRMARLNRRVLRRRFMAMRQGRRPAPRWRRPLLHGRRPAFAPAREGRRSERGRRRRERP